MALSADDIDAAMMGARHIEEQLRLPQGFIVGLLNETDWGFVIKLNAVLESVLNMGITRLLRAVHSKGLEEVVTRLNMAGPIGKVVIAKQLGLIEAEDKRFLVSLAELRNRLVHSVENFGFDFSASVALMDAAQRKEFANKFTSGGHYMLEPVEFEEHPKQFVFCSAIDVLHCVECSTPPAFIQDIRRDAKIDLSDFFSGGSSPESRSEEESSESL